MTPQLALQDNEESQQRSPSSSVERSSREDDLVG